MLGALSEVAQRCRALTARTRTYLSALDAPDAANTGQPPDLPSAAPLDVWNAGRTWRHLQVSEYLGRGSFGAVYRAYDPQLDRQVALKLFARRPESQTTYSQRVLREGRLLARIRHPNIVAIYGADVHEGWAGLWMELVRGETLEARIARDGPCGSQEALFIGQDLCRALAAVHRGGVLHRDVKAQNVMREEGGRILLMDFGTAELGEQLMASARPSLAGTPIYVAPEVLAGRPPSVQSDLYSLGVLLFYLVTGTFPVRAGSIPNLRTAHAERRRTYLQDTRADLPDAFVRLVERALSPDPRDRYRSAGAMQAALAQAAGIEPPSPQPRTHRETRLTIAAIAASVALAGGLATTWYLPNRAGTPTTAEATVATPLVAVRPVLTDDSHDDAFTRALAEDVRRQLATAAEWRISSSQAVDALNTPAQRALAIMRTLGTNAVVEIRVSRAQEAMRSEIRIFRAGLGPQPVIQTLRHEGEDLGPLVETIANRITAHVQRGLKLTGAGPRSQLASVGPEARMHYFKGLAGFQRKGVPNLQAALADFRAAIDLEPAFPLAHAMAAVTILYLHNYGALQPADDAPGLARQYIARALEQDEVSPEAYAALGEVYTIERQWEAADRTFRRALSLSPSHELARIGYAFFMAGRGKLDEAMTQITEAHLLNPHSATVLSHMGLIHHFRGENDESLARFQSATRIDPNYAQPQAGLCRVYVMLGRVSQGVHHCGEANRLGAIRPAALEAQMVQLYTVAGQPERGRAHMGRLRDVATSVARADTAYYLAVAHAALGEHDVALPLLAQALESGAPTPYLRVDPRLAPLRSDSRFDDLIALMERTKRPSKKE